MSADPQILLFDIEEPSDECPYPMVSPQSGYRYGCRCERCKTGKSGPPASPTCRVDGCSGVRLKQRKVCVDHLPRCTIDGCDEPRRLKQGAKYCVAHATSVDNEWQGPRFVSKCCTLCLAKVNTRERNSHPLCPDHRHLGALVKTWRGHGASTSLMRELLAVAECWVCGGDLRWRFHGWSKADGGVHLDHDHSCCPGVYSCGRCIRGLAHVDCNIDLGHLERLLKRAGIERVEQVVKSVEAGLSFGTESA